MSVQAVLARKTLSGGGMWAFAATASAPLAVLAGGLVATYATIGVVGVPLAYLVVGAVVALLSVGYTAMSRHVPHAAAYYAILGRGLGRPIGVAGGMVALVAYNAIQICLYGLFGATMAGLVGGIWWVWALIGLALVGALGVRAVALSTRLLVVILALSVALVLLFNFTAMADPADGSLSFEGYQPSSLMVAGLGGALSMCLAGLMGFEAPASFSEESRSPAAVSRAVFGGVAFLAVLYSFTAWAMGVATGPGNIADAARDPDAGLPFSILEAQFGRLVTPLAQTLLCLAILTSMVAFHSVIARYGFAIAREGVLPSVLATTGTGSQSGSPVGGSILQTCIALVTIVAFAAVGADPIATLFTWLSTLGAVGLLSLLLLASLAALFYLNRNGNGANENVWTRLIAPGLGVLAGAAVIVTLMFNMDALLGVEPGSATIYIIPAVAAVAGVLGLLWAAHLRSSKPEVWAGISKGRPQEHAVPDRRLDDIDV